MDIFGNDSTCCDGGGGSDLTALEAKTQNQSAVAGITDFTGVLNLNGNPIPSSVDLASLQTKTQNQTAVAGTTTFSGTIAPVTVGGGEVGQFTRPFGTVYTNNILCSEILPRVASGCDIGSVSAPFKDVYVTTLVKSGGTSAQYLMADGSSLQYSANSGNSNFYLYKSHLNTPTPPPADGFVYYNNTVQKNATIIYVSHLTEDNIDVEIFFNNLSTLNEVYLQQKTLSNNFIRYNIIAMPTVVVGSHVIIPVAVATFGGTGETAFGVNEPILLSFFSNSIETDARITTLETKTQNQTAIAGTTTLTGDITGVNRIINPTLEIIAELAGSITMNDEGSIIIDATRIFLQAPLYEITMTGNVIMSNNLEVSGNFITSGTVQLQGSGAVQIQNTGVLQIQNTGTCSINPTGALSLKAFNCTGAIAMGDNKITGLAVPTIDTDATTKAYVDTAAFETFRWGTFMISFTASAALLTTSGYMPTTGLSAIGASAATLTQNSSTDTLPRIFRVVNNTAVVANGQRSGYIGTTTFPVLYPRIGFNYNVSFGIGDANTAVTAVTQMLFGLSVSTTAPLFSSTLGPNTTPTIMGIGHDVGDTFLSWYMRGTASGQKIATPFLASTPSAYWLNLNIYNPMNSFSVFLTLTDEITGLMSTQTFVFSNGSPTSAIFQSATLWPLHVRAMAVVGGITNSARCWFSRFQLSIK